MTIATTYALKVLAGATGASHTVNSQQSSDFLAGQPLWLSFFYDATRTTGSGILVLRAKVRWWNAADTELTATYLDISINASIGFTFSEYKHAAPSTAVKCALQFVLTPAASPMQHTVHIKKVRLGRTQVGADVSGDIQGPAVLEAPATSAGVLEGSSPYATGLYKLMEGGSQVTTGITWATDSPAGVTTTFTGSGTGTLSVTGLTVDTVDITLSAARSGSPTRYFKVTVKKNIAPPPTGGGGGSGTTASQTSGFLGIQTGTAAAVSNVLEITVGTSAVAVLATSLTNNPGTQAANGTWYDRYQWYRWNGSAYAAVGSSFDASVATETYIPPQGGDPAENYSSAGSASNSQNYSSSNGTVEKFKLYGWHLGTSTNTTRAMSHTGQISATG